MRLSIRAKVILIGAGLSFLLMSVAFAFSFSIYRQKAEANLALSLDHYMDELSEYCAAEKTLDDLSELTNVIMDEYNAEPDEPTYDTIQEKYEYYRTKYSTLYVVQSGMLGLSQYSLTLRNMYYAISSELSTCFATMGVQYAFVAYRDEARGRLVYVVDCDYHLDDSVKDGVRLPGAYRTLTEDDEVYQLAASEYDAILMGNEKAFWMDINAPQEDGTSKYVATVYVCYNDNTVAESVQSFLITEIIALAIATVVLIILYAVLVHFALLRNLKKLNVGTQAFTDKVKGADALSVVDPEVHSKDELGVLNDSFVTLEEEIIHYAERIREDAAEREKLNAELSVAAEIQAEALPSGEYSDRRVAVLASITSAKEVGGDFYDYFFLDDDHLAVVVADVTGKGVPAALFMMKSIQLIRRELSDEVNLPAAMGKVNNTLMENNRAGLFVTAFVGVIDLRDKTMTCVSAGHEKPYLVGDDEVIRLEVQSNFVLGGIKNFAFQSDRVDLNGKRLFLFTDGLNESINHAREEYGYARIEGSLRRLAKASAQEVLAGVKADLADFVDGEEAFDDVTLLLLDMHEPAQFHMHLDDPDYDAIEQVTDAVNQAFADIAPATVATLDIVLDEILNNLISYEKHEGFAVDVEAARVGDDVVLTFSSNGAEFDPLSVQDKYLTGDEQDNVVGGFGITITRNMSDGVAYRREGDRNVLTVTKHINQ